MAAFRIPLAVLLISVSAHAIPRDFAEQLSPNLWALHVHVENEQGYVESIYEITSVRIRCLAQHFVGNEIVNTVENFPALFHPVPQVTSVNPERDAIIHFLGRTISRVSQSAPLSRRMSGTSSVTTASIPEVNSRDSVLTRASTESPDFR